MLFPTIPIILENKSDGSVDIHGLLILMIDQFINGSRYKQNQTNDVQDLEQGKIKSSETRFELEASNNDGGRVSWRDESGFNLRIELLRNSFFSGNVSIDKGVWPTNPKNMNDISSGSLLKWI